MPVRTVIATLVALSTCVSVAAAAGSPHVSGFVLVALNPQPEPPGITARNVVTERIRVGPDVGRVALNPQPEPPGITTDLRKLLPPGPCRSLAVRVEAPGAPAVNAVATDAGAGKCRYDVAVPGARPDSLAKVMFSRKQ